MRTLAKVRRESAAQEIGHTTVKRNVSWTLLALFCATIISVPTIQHIAEIQQGKLPQVYSIFRLLPVPNLEEIQNYEDTLEKESVVSNWILPKAQSVLTRGFRVGNEQAYLGRNNWLFYRSDVEALTGRGFLDAAHLRARTRGGKSWKEPPQPDAVRALLDFNRQLGARGITLVVMPTSLKPTIQPEKFSGRYRAPHQPIHNPSYRDFVERLRAAGIPVFDPADLLFDAERQSDQYLKTDTHWKPEAMELIATHLAEFLRRYLPLSASDMVHYTRTPLEVTNLGDIAQMLKLPEDASIFSPERVTIHTVWAPGGEAWQPQPDAEVLVLGDSFSNIYSLEGMGWGASAGFVEQLSAALGQPVDKIVMNAGGAYATRQALYQELKRGEDRLAGKRLVVYQFATRELFSGDWKLYEFPAAPPAATVRPHQEESVSIQGTIKDKTEPPTPGSTPYPDCLISLHLTHIQGENGAFPTEEAVVFLWGMRANRWTEAASLKIGQTVRLRVRPWEAVQDRYGSYNRRELESEDAWVLDVYWGEIMP